jgi:hypothetical protein
MRAFDTIEADVDHFVAVITRGLARWHLPRTQEIREILVKTGAFCSKYPVSPAFQVPE